MLAPLPYLKLMPTGGVSLDNATEWLRAGAVAVGAGSALVETDAVAVGRLATPDGQRPRALRASVDAA